MNHTWVYFAASGLVGLLIGSFLNVVIYRGPAIWGLVENDPPRGNLAFPRSQCPYCGAPIRTLHLTPLIGYLMVRGKCVDCRKNIGLRYPLIELAGAAAGIGAFALFGLSSAALLAAIFFWFLIALAAIDAETGYLPDALTLPLIAGGLAANAFTHFVPLTSALIGAFLGYAAFRLIDFAFMRLRGMEGLGQGDAKLLAAVGAWLGWMALAPTVFAGAMLALLGVLIMRLKGKVISNDTAIPFGPALALAAALVMALRPLVADLMVIRGLF